MLSPCLEQGAITDSIARAFGRGFSLHTIVPSASLAVLCLFYVYTAASFAEVRVYPLIDRFTIIGPFIVYIASEYVDHVIIGSLLVLWLTLASRRSMVQYVVIGVFGILFAATAAASNMPALEGIALASLPAIVALLIFNRCSGRKVLRQLFTDLTLNHFAVVGIVIGIMGLALALVPVLFPDPLPQPPTRNYAYDVYLVLSSFSPVLVLLLITCVPVKILSDSILKTLKMQHFFPDLQKQVVRRKFKFVYLVLIMLLSVVIAIIPHLPNVNPDGQQVGVDTGYYVNWVSALQGTEGSGELLEQAFVVQRGGDRPLSLLFIYALNAFLSADLFYTVEYLPFVLTPSLVLVTFFLTRELTSNEIASFFAAFITAVSFHTLIGIYAGFYANWFALILGYLSFLFLFRFLKRRGLGNLIVFGLLILLTLFAHVYTWSVLSIAAGVFLLIGIVRPCTLRTERRNAAFLMAVLLSVLAIDIGRTVLVGSHGGVERDLELAGGLVGPDQFLLRWNNLSYTTTVFVGGLFSSFLVLGLGLYWLVKARVHNTATIFIVIFLSLGVLPFVFGEWIVQTRVFYNIPFELPAAISLAFTAQQKKGFLRALPICILLLLSAIVAATNFYFILRGL